MNKKSIYTLLLIPVWFLIYFYLESMTNWLIYDAIGLTEGKHLSKSIWFFAFEVPKVLLLLVLIIFIVGIIRSYFSAEKTKKYLEGKSLLRGNIMAALLGVVTPFCSCSAIPLFLGFVEAGIPIGVTFSFLIAAPMVNEVAIFFLLEDKNFGWEIALIYLTSGLTIATISGYIIEKLQLQKYVADWVYKVKSSHEETEDETIKSFDERIEYAIDQVKEIVQKIWLYIVIGVGIGAGAHGFIPQDALAPFLGKDSWYGVPLAILAGVPMYSNAAAVVEIIKPLIAKGVSIGTALAFMMSVIGLSLPEAIILKKVLKWQLIAVFIGVVATGIIIVGYILNLII